MFKYKSGIIAFSSSVLLLCGVFYYNQSKVIPLSRIPASTENASCYSAIKEIMAVSFSFNEQKFNDTFLDLGKGYVLQLLKTEDTGIDNLESIIKSISKNQELALKDKKEIWNKVLFKKAQDYKSIELKILAESNHPFAKILLNAKNSTELEDLREIIVSMKSLNPEMSEKEISTLISKRLNSCKI